MTAALAVSALRSAVARRTGDNGEARDELAYEITYWIEHTYNRAVCEMEVPGVLKMDREA